MSRNVTIVVDGVPRRVPDGILLAAALLNLGITAFRRDQAGQPRAPVCGMGTCFECRATVDGQHGVRTCLLEVRDGLRVETAT